VTDDGTLPRLALVGDRSDRVESHTRLPEILDALGDDLGPLDVRWVHSTDATAAELADFDGIWALPGSPYQDADGVLHAVSTARRRRIPFLGTCAGFQHMLLELARNVADLDVTHGASDPDSPHQLLVPLECSLLGEVDQLTVQSGTKAADIMGAGPTTERYFCAYGPNESYVEVLVAHGLVVSALDDDGALRMAEMADHPFFLGCLFQPELSSGTAQTHPVITAFVREVIHHARARWVG
jgi:CTP synthase (UTP-ammonia lyase)